MISSLIRDLIIPLNSIMVPGFPIPIPMSIWFLGMIGYVSLVFMSSCPIFQRCYRHVYLGLTLGLLIVILNLIVIDNLEKGMFTQFIEQKKYKDTFIESVKLANGYACSTSFRGSPEKSFLLKIGTSWNNKQVEEFKSFCLIIQIDFLEENKLFLRGINFVGGNAKRIPPTSLIDLIEKEKLWKIIDYSLDKSKKS